MKNACQVLVFPARYRTCSQRCADAVVHAVQYGQYGETALAMAQDEDPVKCFLDAGIKLSDIVTDEVVIAFVPEMGLCCTCVWGSETGRESRSIWYVGERGRTRLSEQTHTVAAGISVSMLS